VSWPRRIFGVISHKILQLEFSKQSLSHFWVKSRNECPVISDLATHNLLDFCTAYMCETAFSKLKVMKWKIRSFLKNVGNALPPHCLASIYQWIICVKIIKYFHSINFQKLNCFLLIFFVLQFPLRGSFNTV